MSILQILSDAQIRAVAPSVFAPSAHHSRSARYGFISTAEVLQALRAEGFQPVQVLQQRVRRPDRVPFCKHLLRLRLPGAALDAPLVPELIAINAHDGSAAWHLWFGVFRLVCRNGLIVAARELTHIRVQHQLGLVRDVVEASMALARQAPAIFRRIDDWQQIMLPPAARLDYAARALDLRWPDGRAPIGAAELLQVRRTADAGASLWTTLNVVQEHLLGGGAPYTDAAGRNRRTRPVRAIDSTTALNSALWQLTEQVADERPAALNTALPSTWLALAS